MKKIISLFSFIFAFTMLCNAESINYYVATTGADTNDGLSEATALATIDSAIAYIHDSFAGGSDSAYTINMGEGTFNASGISIENNSLALTLNIVGAGADKTTLTAHTDSTDVPNMCLFSQFSAVNSNVSINISQLKIYNYGFTTNNYGAIFYNHDGSAANVSYSLDHCIVEKIYSNLGAIFSTNQATTSFSCTNTYLTDVTTHFQHNRFHSPILALGAGSISINNCVFNNFTRDHTNATQQVNSRWGTIIGATNGAANTIATELTFINNTVINDSLINTSSLNYDQSSIWAVNASTVGLITEFTIANNVFISAQQTFTGNEDAGLKYYNVVNSGTVDINWGTSTNNVMNSAMGFPTDDNTINDMLTYTSSEVAFEMDGDLPKELTADNGLMYVKATGTSIIGGGLADVAPSTDIADSTRNTVPCIGAYEAEQEETAIATSQEISIGLYPNPTSGVVFVKGNVAQLSVYSLAGQLIGTYNVENGQVELSHLSQGAYLVNSISEEGVSINTNKLIKK